MTVRYKLSREITINISLNSYTDEDNHNNAKRSFSKKKTFTSRYNCGLFCRNGTMITAKTPFFLIYVKRIHKDVTEKLIHHENEIIVKNKLIFYILWGGRNFLKGHLTI